jgi:hypothetical protein
LFSIMVVLIFIPKAVYEGSFSPHPCHQDLFLFVFFDDNHSNRSEVESYWGFDLHFLYGQGCTFLHVIFGHLDVFL